MPRSSQFRVRCGVSVSTPASRARLDLLPSDRPSYPRRVLRSTISPASFKSAAQPARCFVWDAAASGFDTSSGLAFRSNLPFVGFPLLVLPVVRGIEQSLRRIRLVSAVRTTTLDSAPPVAIVMASQCWQQRGSFETRKASTVLCSLLASPRDVHDPLSNHQRDEGIRKGSGLSRLPWLLVASSRQDERAMIVIYR